MDDNVFGMANYYLMDLLQSLWAKLYLFIYFLKTVLFSAVMCSKDILMPFSANKCAFPKGIY